MKAYMSNNADVNISAAEYQRGAKYRDDYFEYLAVQEAEMILRNVEKHDGAPSHMTLTVYGDITSPKARDRYGVAHEMLADGIERALPEFDRLEANATFLNGAL